MDLEKEVAPNVFKRTHATHHLTRLERGAPYLKTLRGLVEWQKNRETETTIFYQFAIIVNHTTCQLCLCLASKS